MPASLTPKTPQERELAYYEDLYSGFAQRHFSKAAVAAFRGYLAARILARTAPRRDARVLSLGCGIGDTELLIAPHVGEMVGVDLSPKAVAQAAADASRAGISNARFCAGDWRTALAAHGRFDLVLGIFFLHHLSDAELAAAPAQLLAVLRPGGVVYALEPSAYRLAGLVGKLLVPHLMKRYQTEDERQLRAASTASLFTRAGFAARTEWFDFVSTPLAGLKPSWRSGYSAARFLDHALVRVPLLRGLSANFELIATAPAAAAPTCAGTV
ncbi:MAG TPA: class I SAM-dependent methyltransferase [Bryobacteraceae bacterium]|nr:class I SAM-dependent methyltransferase [Bryobacteraceae bacterium]